jgi:hypothetical protein
LATKGVAHVNKAKEGDDVSAVLEKLYGDARRAVQSEKAKLPVVNPNSPDLEDLFAFGDAVAERSHLTGDACRGVLKAVREHVRGSSRY